MHQELRPYISSHSDLRSAGSDIGYAVKYVDGVLCIPTLEVFPFRASSITKNPLLAFIEDGDSKSDNAIKIDIAFKRLQSNQRIVHVTFYRGGMYKESALYLLDTLKGDREQWECPWDVESSTSQGYG